MEDRRSSSRCEVCNGPTKVQDGKIRCRNSMCILNHRDVQCPRCQHQGPDVNGARNGVYSYSCKECLNSWSE